MRSVICKDKTYTDKEGESPQMTSDPQHGPLEQAVAQEEEVADLLEDPLEEDVQEDHQGHREDPQEDHQVEITTKIGMILKETMKATT